MSIYLVCRETDQMYDKIIIAPNKHILLKHINKLRENEKDKQYFSQFWFWASKEDYEERHYRNKDMDTFEDHLVYLLTIGTPIQKINDSDY